MIYAGIGARDTPPEILDRMASVGRYMASWGHTLRSGGARGADSAFEKGCVSKQGKMEIYLPYQYFNKNESLLFGSCIEARKIAKEFHPVWDNLGDRARDFMGRNSYQILGKDLNTPTDFVVCWTPKGQIVGGTGQALRIARHFNIPVFNFGSMTVEEVGDAIENIIP